jgi:hypothetical protein
VFYPEKERALFIVDLWASPDYILELAFIGYSATAKKIRMAAAFAVIASHFFIRIFTPVYMPAANEGIRELFRACAEMDCKRETMCRALMLSAYEDDEQSRAADLTIRDVYSTVSEILESLIDCTKLDVFRTSYGICLEELWRCGGIYSIARSNLTLLSMAFTRKIPTEILFLMIQISRKSRLQHSLRLPCPRGILQPFHDPD